MSGVLHWASGEGFDHFYGFMAADADDFRSLLWADHRPTENWVGKPGYHLTTDLADKAIVYLTSHVSVTPDRPFFMFWAPSAMHHAPCTRPIRWNKNISTCIKANSIWGGTKGP